MPAAPQWASDGMLTQVAPEQHPSGQLVALQLEHTPPRQVSAPSQASQASPVVPQALTLSPERHVTPLQHPVGQLCGVQVQCPFTHDCPDAQAPPHVPPQPSSPQVLPAQVGVHVGFFFLFRCFFFRFLASPTGRPARLRTAPNPAPRTGRRPPPSAAGRHQSASHPWVLPPDRCRVMRLCISLGLRRRSSIRSSTHFAHRQDAADARGTASGGFTSWQYRLHSDRGTGQHGASPPGSLRSRPRGGRPHVPPRNRTKRRRWCPRPLRSHTRSHRRRAT